MLIKISMLLLYTSEENDKIVISDEDSLPFPLSPFSPPYSPLSSLSSPLPLYDKV